MRVLPFLIPTTVCFVLMLAGISPASAATVTWDGGGRDQGWSTAANWSRNRVPGASDKVVFDATSTKDVTIDVPVSVKSITVGPGYTGGIHQLSDVTTKGDITLTGGTWHAGARTIACGSDLLIGPASGRFIRGTSTVTMTGSGTVRNPNFENAFATFVVAPSGKTTRLGSDIWVRTRCQVSAGLFDLHGSDGKAHTLHLRGAGELLTVAGRLDTNYPNECAIQYEADSSTPVVVTGAHYGLGSIRLLSIGGAQAVFDQSGDIDQDNDIATFVDTPGGSITWNTHDHDVTTLGWMVLGLWGTSHGGTTINAGASHVTAPVITWFSHRSDALNLATSEWRVGNWGVWTYEAMVDVGTSRIIITSGDVGVPWWPVPQRFYDLTIDAPGRAITARADLTMAHDLRVTQGTFVASGRTLTVAHDLTVAAAGVFHAPGAVVEANGAADQTIDLGTTSTLGSLAIGGAAREVTLSHGASVESLSVAAGATLAVAAGQAVVLDHLVLAGTASAPVTVRGVTVGSPWLLDLAMDGTQSLGYVRARDSDATGGQTIDARVSGTDLGGNANWRFHPNMAPSFTKGPDVSTTVAAGGQTIPGWATAISAGPQDESAQALSFEATADQPALFSVQPAISPSGILTFTPAAAGTATVTVRLHDDGGTADAGIDASASQTFIIVIGSGDGNGDDGTPPAISGVVVTITAGLSGDAHETVDGQSVYFTRNSSVTITVTPTITSGSVQSITVDTSDGQSLDYGGDTTSYAPSGEGRFEITATVVAAHGGLTVSATSQPVTLVHVTKPPTLSFYLAGMYSGDATQRPPLTTSLTDDAHLVYLNGMDEANNRPLRTDRRMNVFTKAGFTATAEVMSDAGLSHARIPTASISGGATATLDVAVTPATATDPALLTITGFDGLPESLAYAADTFDIKDYLGRYVLIVTLEDRCGNITDAQSAQCFRLWVDTQGPAAHVAIMPHQFLAHPTFQIAEDDQTELTPARFVAATPDTVECRQEGAAMEKLVLTPEAPPSDASGPAVLSVWALKHPIVPSNYPSELRSQASALPPNCVLDDTALSLMDAAGNRVPRTSSPADGLILAPVAKLHDATLPPTPPGSMSGRRAVNMQAISEQPFLDDRSVWNFAGYPHQALSYAALPQRPPLLGAWAPTMPLVTQFDQVLATYAGLLPGELYMIINGQTIPLVSTVPPLIYSFSQTPTIKPELLRFTNHLAPADGEFGPGAITVPPSWRVGSEPVTVAVHRAGLAAPIKQPIGHDSIGYTYFIPSGTTPTTYTPRHYAAGLDFDHDEDIHGDDRVLGSLSIGGPGGADVLDRKLAEVVATAPAGEADSDTRRFTFDLDRSQVTPGRQRFTYHREGGDTTPLNDHDSISPEDYVTTGGGSVYTHVHDHAYQVEDHAITSRYEHGTGFRWANLVKIDNDVISTGAQTLRIEAGFQSSAVNPEDLDTTQPAIRIMDPQLFSTAAAILGLTAAQDRQHEIRQKQLLFDHGGNATTSPSQVLTDAKALMSAALASDGSAASDALETIDSDLSAAEAQIAAPQQILGTSADATELARARHDLLVAQSRAGHDRAAAAAIRGPDFDIVGSMAQVDAAKPFLSATSNAASIDAAVARLTAAKAMLPATAPTLARASGLIASLVSELQALRSSAGTTAGDQANAGGSIVLIADRLAAVKSAINDGAGSLQNFVYARNLSDRVAAGTLTPAMPALVIAVDAVARSLSTAADAQSDVTEPLTDEREPSPTRIAVSGQRLVATGPNASLRQTFEVDLQVGAEVGANIYDVDVRLGAVKAYSDELSQLTAGANGAHRMKGALAVYKLKFKQFDQSGGVTDLTDNKVPFSTPNPIVTLSSSSFSVGSQGQTSVDGYINLAGSLTSSMCDVTAGASINQVTVFVDQDKTPVGTISVNVTKGSGAEPRKYPYSGAFNGSVAANLKPGPHTIKVRATDPVIGKVGYAEVSLEVRAQGGNSDPTPGSGFTSYSQPIAMQVDLSQLSNVASLDSDKTVNAFFASLVSTDDVGGSVTLGKVGSSPLVLGASGSDVRITISDTAALDAALAGSRDTFSVTVEAWTFMSQSRTLTFRRMAAGQKVFESDSYELILNAASGFDAPVTVQIRRGQGSWITDTLTVTAHPTRVASA